MVAALRACISAGLFGGGLPRLPFGGRHHQRFGGGVPIGMGSNRAVTPTMPVIAIATAAIHRAEENGCHAGSPGSTDPSSAFMTKPAHAGGMKCDNLLILNPCSIPPLTTGAPSLVEPMVELIEAMHDSPTALAGKLLARFAVGDETNGGGGRRADAADLRCVKTGGVRNCVTNGLDHTLQSTALVDTRPTHACARRPDWTPRDRWHFFRLARIMRYDVLVDARARRVVKRGGDVHRHPPDRTLIRRIMPVASFGTRQMPPRRLWHRRWISLHSTGPATVAGIEPAAGRCRAIWALFSVIWRQLRQPRRCSVGPQP